MPQTLEERLKELEEKAKEPEGEKEPAPASVYIETADGERVTGASYEEIARSLASRKPIAAPEPEPAEPAKKPAYDERKFAETFLQSPQKAMDYYEETVYGFKVREAVPLLAQSIASLAKRGEDQRALEEERASVEFVTNTPDYVRSDRNLNAIMGVLEEGKLPVTVRNLKRAWSIVKDEGGAEIANNEPPAPMPRSRRGGASSYDDGPPMPFALASDDSLEQLKEERRDDLAKFLRGR